MTTFRRLQCTDLLRFNQVNLDRLTETFYMPFYQQYLAKWPEYFEIAQTPGQHTAGYVMGKVEGKDKNWHGHVTAVTVAPAYRRLGLASQLMHFLERVSEDIHNGYFVDLYVRESNHVAVNMYKQLGYVIYRRVLGYYSGEEDAFDMRKALRRDPLKESMIPLPHPVYPNPYED